MISPPAGSPPPTPEEVVITWPRAAAKERALHFDTAGTTPARFVSRSLALDMDGHTGMLLPAPSSASWRVKVPERGRLDLRAGVLPAAIAGPASDGARLVVEVDGAVALDVALKPPGDGPCCAPFQADLAAYAGREVELTLRTAPGGTSDGDLVFLEDPTLFTPTDRPRRVVLAFLDTVRPDHLGMYGYARPTTPKLDAWARSALIFDRHRTVAPWTLPSARSAITGAEPERWASVDTLPGRLARAGFYTDGYVGNAFLSPTFAMHRGFASYRFDHLAPAKRVVDHAIEVMQRHADRDVMVWAQFMEAHLPYNEPAAYQSLFAGEKPDGLTEVSKVALDKIGPQHPQLDAIRAYVSARYDQNIRVLDDELMRLIDAAGPDATIVLFADHGEELWEHGGFEHGHAFWEELLRVPFVVFDPHLPQGRFDAPSSLLDLTPTVLALQGLPADAPDGVSLVAPAFDPAAREALKARPLAFGRPLYGEDGWGVVDGASKTWTRAAKETQYDLAADPSEQHARAPDPAWRGRLGEALDVPVERVWRVSIGAQKAPEALELTVRHPTGLGRVWKAYDPRSTSEGLDPRLEDGVVRLTAAAGQGLPSALYLQPTTPGADPTGLTIEASRGGAALRGACASADATPLIGDLDPKLRLRVEAVWLPAPFGEAVPGTSSELTQQLKELGYLDP
jgi:arylsulfatase A-like enzyme